MRMELKDELLEKVTGGVAGAVQDLSLEQLIDFAEGFQVTSVDDMKKQMKKLGLTASDEDILKGFNQFKASFL